MIKAFIPSYQCVEICGRNKKYHTYRIELHHCPYHPNHHLHHHHHHQDDKHSYHHLHHPPQETNSHPPPAAWLGGTEILYLDRRYSDFLQLHKEVPSKKKSPPIKKKLLHI